MRAACVLILCLLNVPPLGAQEQVDEDHLAAARVFADTLLATGLDTYGHRQTSMWASVIDTRDLSVPEDGVPPTEGVRFWDRAVGGSNLYHDVTTLKVFYALTDLTGEPRYAEAADAYLRDALELTQNPQTGLLGWGEHIYYDLRLDKVTINVQRRDDTSYGLPHELIAWTPPWAELWAVDPARTAKAIEGLKWHYKGPDPQVYLFNRHAQWAEATHQNIVMPWIKHAALFSYSFAFLNARQPSDDLAHWYRHTGLLYWKLRDEQTGLVFGCLVVPNKQGMGKDARLAGTAMYSYWLFKAAEQADDDRMRSIALGLMRDMLTHAWDADAQTYASTVTLSGQRSGRVGAWDEGYESPSTLWQTGRLVMYLAGRTKDDLLLEAIGNLVALADKEALPADYTAENVADAVHFYLDHYELTGREASFSRADDWMKQARQALSSNGLFVRRTSDPYYEAKLGIGDLVAGMVRLHVALGPAGAGEADSRDWSR